MEQEMKEEISFLLEGEIKKSNPCSHRNKTIVFEPVLFFHELAHSAIQ